MTSVEWRNWLIAAGENRGWQVPAKYGRQKEFSKFQNLAGRLVQVRWDIIPLTKALWVNFAPG